MYGGDPREQSPAFSDFKIIMSDFPGKKEVACEDPAGQSVSAVRLHQGCRNAA